MVQIEEIKQGDVLLYRKNNKKGKQNNSRRNNSKRKYTPFGDTGAIIGSTLGSKFGPLGTLVGGGLGRLGGSMIGKIFGSGAYAMQNSVWNVSQQCPVMHSSDESIIFRHREYICDISASNAFSSREFSINPGLDETFPFLSTIAQNFQQYRFRGLVFEFRSTSATSLVSGTNTAMGVVMLAAQYRSDAPDFRDKQTLLNEMWSVDTKPSENVFLPLECNPQETPLKFSYIRTGSLAANQDIKLYDLATLTVASQGSQATNIVGELWATYEVELKKPTISGSLELAGESFIIDRSGVATANPFGTTTNGVAINTMGIPLPTTGAAITIPAGQSGVFYFTWFIFGSSAAVTLPTITLSAGLNYVSVGSNNRQDNTGTGSELSTSFLFRKDDSTTTDTITLATTGWTPPAGAPRMTLQIHQVNGSIVAT